MRQAEFTTSEAAALTEQPVHRIQKFIDSGTIPRRIAADNRRVLTDADLIFVWVLNRAFADAEIDNRLKATLHERITAVAEGGGVTADELRVTPFLIVKGLKGLVAELQARVERLERASELIEANPGIKGGEPVIAGTRVPVYLIAAMLDQGATPEEIGKNYPTLDAERIELARVYAQAHPRVGRPPRQPWR